MTTSAPASPSESAIGATDSGACAGHERLLAEQQLLRRHPRHDRPGQMSIATVHP